MSEELRGPWRWQHRRMHRLWNQAKVADRDDRLALTAAIVGRPVASSSELTVTEADLVTHYLQRLDDAGVLADKARAYLAALPERVKAAG